MHLEDSTPDAYFVEVKEGVDEMIEFLANEPSVGLFFVQEHAKSSMPCLLSIQEKIWEKVHEVVLHTEDIEDSICSVRLMKDHGIPIANEMIKDINRSLSVMSASPPKRGLIRNPSWGVQKNNYDPRDTLIYGIGSDQRGSNYTYLSSAFNLAKQKAAGLGWSQLDIMAGDPCTEQLSSSLTPSQVTQDVTPTTTDTESDELPLSSQLLDDQLDDIIPRTEGMYHDNKSTMLQEYDKFKSVKEAKFKEWLEEPASGDVPSDR